MEEGIEIGAIESEQEGEGYDSIGERIDWWLVEETGIGTKGLWTLGKKSSNQSILMNKRMLCSISKGKITLMKNEMSKNIKLCISI